MGGGRDPPQMKVGRSVRRVFRFHWLFRGLVRPRRLLRGAQGMTVTRLRPGNLHKPWETDSRFTKNQI